MYQWLFTHRAQNMIGQDAKYFWQRLSYPRKLLFFLRASLSLSAFKKTSAVGAQWWIESEWETCPQKKKTFKVIPLYFSLISRRTQTAQYLFSSRRRCPNICRSKSSFLWASDEISQKAADRRIWWSFSDFPDIRERKKIKISEEDLEINATPRFPIYWKKKKRNSPQ